MMVTVASRQQVGPLVREWRLRRRRTQMDLALDAGLSTRHLSFVETGRSKPSPELLLTLADRLEIPLRDRNRLLLAAGYAPLYSQTPIDDQALDRARGAIQQMLDHHDPYPGVAVDRMWNVVLANRGAARLTGLLPPELRAAPINVFRACLHPAGFAPLTVNLAEWAHYLLGELRRLAARTADPEAERLLNEMSGYPAVKSLLGWHQHSPTEEPALLVPWKVRMGDHVWSLFTTITSFGTPSDITLDELAVELFYPADKATESLLGQAGEGAPTGAG